MKKNILVCTLFLCLNSNLWSQSQDLPLVPKLHFLWETDAVIPTVEFVPKKVEPILMDKLALSGLGLKQVTSSADPERVLFQKRLYHGEEISVYIVASETKTAHWENYGLEEFIYVFNGRARLHPMNADQQYFYPGDFFIVPKGYSGEWETQGGATFYYELSVIANDRSTIPSPNKMPVGMHKAKIAGIDLTPMGNKENEYYDVLHQGKDLIITTHSEKPTFLSSFTCDTEQLIYVIAGAVTLQTKEGEQFTYYTGDFFVLPKEFKGSWKSEGHELFRTLRVQKAK